MQFSNRVALVTGAANGIGRVTARRFAEEGARLAICDVDEAGLAEAETELRGLGAQVLARRVDVSRSAEVSGFIAETASVLGGLDCAFNNAGLSGGGLPLLDTDDETWARCLQGNLSSVFYCLREEVRLMLQAGGGTIVNNCSVLGTGGGLGAAGTAYTATKHGVAGLTRNAAIAYAQKSIRVNAVCPGIIEAGMGLKVMQRPQEQVSTLMHAQPMGRAGSAEEVADAVLWLCSPQSSYITGHLLAVDGGFRAR